MILNINSKWLPQLYFKWKNEFIIYSKQIIIIISNLIFAYLISLPPPSLSPSISLSHTGHVSPTHTHTHTLEKTTKASETQKGRIIYSSWQNTHFLWCRGLPYIKKKRYNISSQICRQNDFRMLTVTLF